MVLGGFKNIVLCSFMTLVIASLVKGKSKPLTASLYTKWRSTPLILEASEFVAEENPDAFWKYVDTIIGFGIGQLSQTSRSLYSAAIKASNIALGSNPESLQSKLLKFSLSVRNYSPKIEMQHQLAKSYQMSGCDLFFDVHGKITCSYTEVYDLVIEAKEKLRPTPTVFEKDHVYPVSCSLPQNVILYGDITSEKFKDAHEFMKRMVSEKLCCYRLRHFVRARPVHKSRLSGYGIELAIKSTEYKAVDDSQVKDDAAPGSSDVEGEIEVEGFNFATLRHLHPNLSSELNEFRNALIDSSNEMKPMKIWQLQDLSFQAAARVMNSPTETQLSVLQDISQNFPLRVRSLVKQQVSADLRHEIQRNQKSFEEIELDSGDSTLLINGLQIDLDDTDMFELLDLLRDEAKLIDGLRRLGLEAKHVRDIVKLKLDRADNQRQHVLDIRDPAVVWLNDIENDARYERWPANVHELLRPAFPGTLRRIRKNMHHLLLVVDPSRTDDLNYLVESLEIFWANDVPLRIGVVFVVDDADEADGNDDVGVALLRAYNFAKDRLDDTERAFNFLAGIFKSLSEDEKLSVNHIKERITKKFKFAENVEDILGKKSSYDDNRQLGKAFCSRVGLSGGVNVLMNGELLTETEYSPENFEQTVIERIMHATPFLQRSAYMGTLRNEMNVFDFLMSQSNVVPRFNTRILNAPEHLLSFTGHQHKDTVYWNVKEFAKLSPSDMTATLAAGLSEHYLSKTDSGKHVRPVTMWVVADVESERGRQFVYNSLKHAKSSSLTRLAIVHNPADLDPAVTGTTPFVRAIEAAVSSQQNNNARNFISKLLKPENAAEIASGRKTVDDFVVSGMNTQTFDKLMTGDPRVTLPHIGAHAAWVRAALNVQPGNNAVVVNGKVIGPLRSDEQFLADDFHLIESLVHAAVAERVGEAVNQLKLKLSPPETSDMIMKLSAHLAAQPKSDQERKTLTAHLDQHSVVKLDSATSSEFDITVVLDPASKQAQQITPVVAVLREVLDANLRIFMNCKEKLSDIPIKRFYRYVLDSEPRFKVDNSESDGPRAQFADMPAKSLLTLTMHPPEGWMVEVVRAVHDLDNLKLDDVTQHVTAEFELEYLVLEGHANDVTTGSPPRGLQFTLGRSADTVEVDTIVMANLGYFQLKTTPGVWHLNLREGRSRDIYQIISYDNKDVDGEVIVLMDNFKSKVVVLKLAKKPDKLNVMLLDEKNEGKGKEKDEGGLWNSIANTFGGGSSAEGGATSDSVMSQRDVINVFSLASGHLYERLMRIMMLSVMRHTNTKVKFWVLKNYISPQFKDFIPVMAKEYGFEYELIQYKWPRWLNQQTEKQRTMWGYKILFLDVLFPLDVDKIIFVDADQIVRADLKELRDLDLEGNPYGYTPFCSDRKEMDGFRFWKGGYWAGHLAGRKYHISAIYVVDLVKFRQIAAGDRLRGQYQGLSQDPNSLANLDQDLPNNMIHQVGIKSLPQEWLWCATWCSEDSKHRAKTIDLCNNPLTKEPKLEAAVRIVKEWPDYDNEIKQLQQRWESAAGNISTSGTKKSTSPHEEL